MPWRDDPQPYAVWISEIMLQQTQVVSVLPKFDRFVARFPDVATLAAADLQDVLRIWEGLGYYARARNLHRAARHIMGQWDGALPRTAAQWRTLPGVGPYVSAAIASIAFDEAVPAVDGNVLRVIARFRGLAADIARPDTAAAIRAGLTPAMRGVSASAFNQALMELGALVCRPRGPRCGECPLARTCVARRQGRTAELPVKTRAGAGPHVPAVAGLVIHRGRVLMTQRPASGLLGGLWEFPSMPVAGDADLREAVAVAVRAATGVAVRADREAAVIDHAYSHFRTTVRAFACTRLGGRTRRGDDVASVAWVTPEALAELPLTRVARRLAAVLAW